MPSAIVETATKATPIDAPVGADPRTAASVRTPLQAVGNRLAWLEAFVTRIVGALTDVSSTGILEPTDDVIVDLDNGFWTFKSTSGDYALVIDATTKLIVNGRIGGHCFDGTGGNGRANRRVSTIAPAAASTTDVDPTLHDLVWVNAAGGCSIRIEPDPSVAYKIGDHITIKSTTIFVIDVKNPAGVTLAQLQTGNDWVEIVLAEDGVTWKVGEIHLV